MGVYNVVNELGRQQGVNTLKPVGFGHRDKGIICRGENRERTFGRFIVVQNGLATERLVQAFSQKRLLEDGVVRALDDDVPGRRAGVACRHQDLIDDVDHAIERHNVFMEDGGSVEHDAAVIRH